MEIYVTLVFVVGDLSNKLLHQITTAVGGAKLRPLKL